MEGIYQLRALLNGSESGRLYVFLGISIFIAFLEMSSLVLLVPYLNLATGTEESDLESIFLWFGVESLDAKIVSFGAVLVIVYIIRMLIILLYKYELSKFVLGIRHRITASLFCKYSAIDYVHFTTLSSSFLGKTLLNESNRIAVYLKAGIDLFTEAIVISFLLVMILLVDWRATILTFGVFGMFIAFIVLQIRPKIKIAALNRAKYNNQMHYYFDNLIRNFKYIKSTLLESEYSERFGLNSEGFSRVEAKVQYWQGFQKYTVETVCLVTVVILVLFFSYSSSDEVIEKLAFFAIAFFRLIPSANKITASISQLQYNQNVISQIASDLELKTDATFDLLKIKPLSFEHQLMLNNISFSYNGSDKVLDDFSLCIPKGEHLAIAGESGSGKSTLADILLGVVFADEGSVEVDGVALTQDNLGQWRKMFGYIPQEINLFDSSIADNIAFGREYNEKRIIEVLKQARVYDFFKSRNGLDTRVGDNGVQLSGGQKQRIGIARALYLDPDVLVLDEATSALDLATEEQIMDEIYEICSGKTLIIIAHRLSTLKRCSHKVELNHHVQK